MQGKTIRKYKILKHSGKGASAQVYKAINTQTQQTVAMKIFTGFDISTQKNVKKQVTLLQSLNHPNIIKCYDYFCQNGTWYIVMQYCGQGDFQKYAKQVGRMDQEMAHGFIQKLLNCLIYLHQNNIAHRDLKLANLLIDDKYQIKLADFGFSKNYQEDLLVSRCGTPMTMAPEILFETSPEQSQNYTAKCDTWSLGIISYLLICGQYPFQPTRGNTSGGINGLKEDIKKNSKKIIYNSKIELSKSAKDFISQCLKFQPKDRPFTKDLQNHEWMKTTIMQSVIRKGKMEQSLGISSQIIEKFKCVLHSEIKKHAQELIKRFLLTNEQVSRLLKQMESNYSENKQIRQNLGFLLNHKLTEMQKIQIKINLGNNKQIWIKASQIENLKNHSIQLKKFIKQKLSLNAASVEENNQVASSSISRKLIQFITSQDIYNFSSKMPLCHSICLLVCTSFSESQISLTFKFIGINNQQTNQLLQYLEHNMTKTQLLSSCVNNEIHIQYTQKQQKKDWIVQNKYLSLQIDEREQKNIQILAKILQNALKTKMNVERYITRYQEQETHKNQILNNK